MTQSHYELPFTTLKNAINALSEKIPSDERKELTDKMLTTIDRYEGVDNDCLNILVASAQRGRLDEFLDKLYDHYKESLRYVKPAQRRDIKNEGAKRADAFFKSCYDDMCMKPCKE